MRIGRRSRLPQPFRCSPSPQSLQLSVQSSRFKAPAPSPRAQSRACSERSAAESNGGLAVAVWVPRPPDPGPRTPDPLLWPLPETLDPRPRTLAFVHFKNSPFSKTGGKLVFLRAFLCESRVSGAPVRFGGENVKMGKRRLARFCALVAPDARF